MRSVLLMMILAFLTIGQAKAGTCEDPCPIKCDLPDTYLGKAGSFEFTKCVSPKVQSSQPGRLESSINAILCEGVKCSGERERASVEKYTAQISPSSYKDSNQVGKSNVGLRNYFKGQIAGDACFAALAYRYYQSPELLKAASSKVDAASQAGAAWNLALKTANGNKNLAMSLIGTCGHDDNTEKGNESNFSVCLAKSDLQVIQSLSHNQCRLSDNPGLGGVNFRCPEKGTSFFAPGGLPGTDLSPQLKDQLAQEHAPGVPLNEAKKTLPHKYYHVYGSAYLACQLIQDGVPKPKALAIERMTALMYRAVRVCDASHKNMQNYNSLLEQMKKEGLSVEAVNFSRSPSEVKADFNRQNKIIISYLNKMDLKTLSGLGLSSGVSSDQLSDPETVSVLNQKIKHYPGIVLAGFLSSQDSENLSSDQRKQRLSKYYGADSDYFNSTLEALRDRTHSSILKWGGKISGVFNQNTIASFAESAPCIDNALLNFATAHDYQCNGFNDCDLAKKKLETYEADFVQTSEYHKLGGKFASDNCSVKSAVDNQAACSALNHWKGPSSPTLPSSEKPIAPAQKAR